MQRYRKKESENQKQISELLTHAENAWLIQTRFWGEILQHLLSAQNENIEKKARINNCTHYVINLKSLSAAPKTD